MSKFAVGVFSQLKCRFKTKSWKTENTFSSGKRKGFLAKGYPEETLATVESIATSVILRKHDAAKGLGMDVALSVVVRTQWFKTRR